MEKIRAGIVNLVFTDNISRNTKRILFYLKKAKDKKLDVICFPECSLTGFRNTITKNNSYLKLISERTREYGLNTIVCGYLQIRGSRYNSAILINSKGMQAYHKKKSWNEKISEGKRNLIFTIKGYRCAILICWDVGHPRIIESVVRQGAEIIFWPSYWEGDAKLGVSRNKDLLKSMCIARAQDYGVIMALANSVGKKNVHYSGIASPRGIERETQKTEALLYFDVRKRK